MKYQLLKITLICILIGILAGILSSSLIYSYFLSFADVGGAFIDKQDNSLQIKMRLMDEETKKSVLNSIVVFYKIKPVSKDSLKNIFFEKDRVGYGFVATSDGWAIADKIVSAFGIKQIVAVSNDGKIIEIEKIEKDLKNNLAFVRLDATGLKPISFGNPRDLMPGENLYLIDESQKVTKVYFNSIGYKPVISESSVINTSENFGKTLFFNEFVGSEFNGLPILNYRGDAVGIIRGEGKNVLTGIPFDYAQKSLQSLFRYGKIRQPSLGLRYLDLSHIITADKNQKRRGALILSTEDGKIGLETEDLVLKINDDELNKEYNLSEILSDYQIGDVLDFNIFRDGKEQIIKVKVGE